MGPVATSARRPCSASWTSTSKPTRRPARRPVTRAREPAVRRGVSRSSTSKGIGAQRATASGSVRMSSTASGPASTMVVAVQVFMLRTVPARRPRVVGRGDDPEGAPGRPGLILEDDPGSPSRRTSASPARVRLGSVPPPRSVIGRIRALPAGRAAALLAVVLLPEGAAEVVFASRLDPGRMAIALALLTVEAVALAFRRRALLVAVVVVFGLMAVFQSFGRELMD